MRKPFGLALGLAALAFVGSAAHAQFMTNYPVIIVPPPAQNVVIPRPSPTTRQLDRQYPPPAPAPDASRCHYQGQTRVCG
jgi:hypothetical protein